MGREKHPVLYCFLVFFLLMLYPLCLSGRTRHERGDGMMKNRYLHLFALFYLSGLSDGEIKGDEEIK
ncbi:MULTISPECIES: hypothetical protein [Dickeya]|uniref:hypothetical protein n=1 Tax=Dickeya TaxID=204037 RepID=UPI00059ABA7C|nr:MULTISPECIES: hypothetical protein [Dickeya]MBP2837157.1 hypothetical protein [Dickeya parazeae]UCZ77310.1 hypothetical protein LHK94_10205 [Dickeya zeae]